MGHAKQPTLMTLPLEIRLAIWRLSIPYVIEADCCEQAVPKSSRRLSTNPWYPSPILPTFTYPQPRVPLRLLNHQANHEIKAHIPLPKLIARACDYMCLRRGLNVLSNSTSTANEIDLARIAAFRIVHERVGVVQPLFWTMSQETRWMPRREIGSDDARRQRVAQTYIRELDRFYRDVRLVYWSCDDSDADWSTTKPVAGDPTMLYEVHNPIRTVVCGDGSMVVVQRPL